MTTDTMIDEVMNESLETGDTTEIEAPATDEAEVEAEEAETKEEAAEIEKPNDPKKLENALNKAKSKLSTERQANKQMRERLEALEARFQEQNRPAPAQEPDEVESYVSKIAAKQAEQLIQKQLQQYEQTRSVQNEQSQFLQKIEQAKAAMPDIEQVFAQNAHVELPEYVIKAIKKLPDGAALAYQIFKEDLLDDLEDLDDVEGMLKIAEIRKSVENIGKPKPVTKAPAPLKAQKGLAGGSKSLGNMNADELYNNWYRVK